VGRFFSSLSVVIYPRGLLSMMYRQRVCRFMGRPSISMLSSGPMIVPMFSTFIPLTVILPPAIRDSTFLREPSPHCAMYLLRRIPMLFGRWFRGICLGHVRFRRQIYGNPAKPELTVFHVSFYNKDVAAFDQIKIALE
jgi:hypothetical protein